MTPTAKKALITFLLIIGVTIMVVLGVLKSRETPPPQGKAWEGAVQDVGDRPAIGGAFHLIDQNGHSRSEKDFLGKTTLIYFGYTFCPDICPMALGNLSALLNDVDTDKINVVFITIDPARDTIAQLKNYATNFHPSIVFLSGNEDQIKQAIGAYHVYAAKVQDAGMTDYVMDHSSIIYVMDETGQYVKSFNHQTPAEEMKQGLKGVI